MTDQIPDESSETLESAGFTDQKIQVIHDQLMREKEEPEEGFSPMPIFLLFLFGALLFWGGIYITRYSGNFRADVFDPNWTPAPVTTQAAVFDPIKQGKKLYTRQCQQCHQADGMGIPSVYPHLNTSSWVTGETDSDKMRLAKLLIIGMSGEVEVDGETYNGNMPPVGMWKDRDIAAVLTFVRQNWENKASPVDESIVKQARDEVKGRSAPWTSAELLAEHPF